MKPMTEQQVQAFADLFIAALPGALAVYWLIVFTLNLYLAGRIVLASGRLGRDWPDLPALTYPVGFPLLLALAAARRTTRPAPSASPAPASRAALLLAYLLAGLALAHFIARGRAPWVLWFVYAGLILFGPYAAIVITLGGLDRRRLQAEAAPRRAPAIELEPASQENGAPLCRSYFWSASAASARWAMSSPSRTATRATSCCRRRRRCAPPRRTWRASRSNRGQLEARNLELKKEAEAVAAKLDGQSFVAIRQAGDTGQLYGSVTTRDMVEIITAGGFSIDRRQVVLDRPIKTLGVHATRIALHPEVIVGVSLNVARTEDEAERQARGEDVTVVKEEALELETFNPEAVFEEEVQVPPGHEEQPTIME